MASQLIEGPAGPLEVLVERPDSLDHLPTVVICHPHSLYGGSMTNKVVHMLAKLGLSLGLRVVRFNFRGVGRSAGTFSHGLGEQADCLAVIDWLRQSQPTLPIWLAGFSFGSFVAYTSHFRVDSLTSLTLVAPPVRMFEFGQYHPISIPWTIIQGKADEITDYVAVEQWASQFTGRKGGRAPKFHLLEEVDHFFNGKLNLLDTTLRPFWQSLLK